MIERRIRILIQVLPWASRGIMVLWITRFSVIQFLIPLPFTLYFSFFIFFIFLFFIPLLRGSSLLYIATGIASQPSTWMAIDLSLDTCPIVALLVVVE